MDGFARGLVAGAALVTGTALIVGLAIADGFATGDATVVAPPDSDGLGTLTRCPVDVGAGVFALTTFCGCEVTKGVEPPPAEQPAEKHAIAAIASSEQWARRISFVIGHHAV